MVDYYEVLGIRKFTDSQDEIRKAYRLLIVFFHPDKGNVVEEIALEKTKQLNEAYETLKDIKKKEKYDRELRAFLDNDVCGDYFRAVRAYDIFNNSRTIHKYGGFNSEKYNFDEQEDDDADYSDCYEYENSSTNSQTTESKANNRKNTGCIIWIVLIVLFVLLSFLPSETTEDNKTQYTTSQETSEITQEYEPVEIINGKLLKHPGGDCPCEFTVKTSEGSNYYIYMDNINNDNDLAFYVVGGKTVTKSIPLGTYKLYYCTGQTWYGKKQKFGPETKATTSDELFEFTKSISGDHISYDSWTVTLYEVYNGNMTTEDITISEFPE